MKKASIEIFYIIFVILVPSVCLYFFSLFTHYSNWIEIPVIAVVDIIVIAILLDKGSAILAFIVPKKYCDDEGFFYSPTWKSKEFDHFIGDELLDLYVDNCNLFDDYQIDRGTSKLSNLSDYSHLVLPIAKTYEGVLKKILIKKKLLKEEDLINNPSINVGGYFNPVGNKSIFNLLRDKVIPHVIYATYQECRNQILHYDPYRDNRIKSIEDAKFYQRRILDAIDKAYETFNE